MKQYLFLLPLLLLLFVCSCEDNDDDKIRSEFNIETANGLIVSPVWLSEAVDELAFETETGEKRCLHQVWAKYIEGELYILIYNPMFSDSCKAVVVYTGKGEKIVCGSEEYAYLSSEFFKKKNPVLIWDGLNR